MSSQIFATGENRISRVMTGGPPGWRDQNPPGPMDPERREVTETLGRKQS